MKYTILCAAALLSLSACMTNGPDKVKVEGDGYKVEVSDQDNKKAGSKDHCPPGHHMKGWC